MPDTDQPDALEMDAYNAYLQGRYYLNRLGPENYRKAISYFELAVESAPYSALYWAGLSEANSLYGFVAVEGPHAALRRAREAAETALTIDDAIPEVHSAMARISSFDWDWSGVEDSLRTALELRPNDVSALEELTIHLHRLYRLDDAIRVAEKVIALDPLNVNIQQEYAQILFAADRVDDAEKIMRRLFSQDPSTSLTPFNLAWILAFSGRATEAIEYAEMEPVEFLRFTVLAIAQHRAGNHDLSVVAQRKVLTSCGEVCAYQQAQIHAVWGDADKSMEWLARAFKLGDAGMMLMKQDTALALFADDPRYIDLLERMGLAD